MAANVALTVPGLKPRVLQGGEKVAALLLALDKTVANIFAGWIFASSPGLNAIEHPVYDIWLLDCRQTPKAQADAELDESGEAYVAPGDLGVPAGEIPLPPPRPFI